jgi:hypothetical protein
MKAIEILTSLGIKPTQDVEAARAVCEEAAVRAAGAHEAAARAREALTIAEQAHATAREEEQAATAKVDALRSQLTRADRDVVSRFKAANDEKTVAAERAAAFGAELATKQAATRQAEQAAIGAAQHLAGAREELGRVVVHALLARCEAIKTEYLRYWQAADALFQAECGGYFKPGETMAGWFPGPGDPLTLHDVDAQRLGLRTSTHHTGAAGDDEALKAEVDRRQWSLSGKATPGVPLYRAPVGNPFPRAATEAPPAEPEAAE